MIFPVKNFVQLLFLSICSLCYSQEPISYKLFLDESIEVDSIVLVVNNFHDYDAINWQTPFEYQRIKLTKGNQGEYFGVGLIQNNIASGKLLIWNKIKNISLQVLIKNKVNTTYLTDIDYEDALLTSQKYLKFDHILIDQIELIDSLNKLESNIYEQFGIEDPDYPEIRTLSVSDANLLKIAKINLLKDNPDLDISLLKLFEIFNLNINDSNFVLYKDAFSSLTQELKNSALGKQFCERLATKLKTFDRLNVGSQVPQFTGYTEDNKVFSNSNFDKPYILAFGATWCIPCKENLEPLKSLKNNLKIEVIYINLDDDKEKWKKLIREENLDWINISDGRKISESKIAEDFNIYFLPKYFVVNEHGKIIYTMDILEKKRDNLESQESSINTAIEKERI